MKRKTLLLEADIIQQIKSAFNLNQIEITELMTQAKRYDPKGTGFVSKNEVDDIMRDLKLLSNEKMIAKFKEEIKTYEGKQLELKQICDLYCKLKNYQQQLEDEETITQEYIDAFVALGGQPDRSGYVQKQTIIDIIQQEFELKIDLESFLGDFQGDKLEFEDFCQLFENAGEDAKSFITSFSQAKRNNTDFTVRFKDFEKWEKTAM
ncbi:unnamed protein product (macronuclear) [Paramecium tetraurelia]|uniref:EF-hand domain-containing protein n=1 Tax=Paramecium tetraurelia TaxID=5888 RepID=A0CG06_PARTE|nr:uncharacterized protein GSPATT00038166001 [Paramecium tetraurelia]CAK69723.1 unnamed protein product [Paramecium tetraurelia]|eukprot:XP_001437120.1 hypothetical protein (macronuclear) [Paramecium tetraurelia strain d4-2]